MEPIKSYSELSLASWQEVNKILDEDMPDHLKEIEIVQVLSGKTVEEFDIVSIPEYAALVEDTKFLYEEPKQVDIKEVYTLNGKDYKLLKDILSMNARRWVYYIQCLSKDSSVQNLHNILAVLLYRDGQDLTQVETETLAEIAEDALYMSTEDALSISNFFLAASINLQVTSLSFLQRKTRETLKKAMRRLRLKGIIRKLSPEEREAMREMKDLLRGGGGIIPSMK